MVSLRNLVSALVGALFGLGLVVAGMTDTRSIQAFLDIFGAWDPSVAVVMVGAMLPMALAWRIAARRKAPRLGGAFPPMPPARFDRDLVGGSMAFGAGWALTGLCPGPAIASVGFGGWQGIVFVLAMIVGASAARFLRAKRA